MSINLPDWIDEFVDTTDPLSILLAREGDADEAYQLARQYRSGQAQVVIRAEIEDNEEISSDGEWSRRTRKMSSTVMITRNYTEQELRIRNRRKN